MFFAIWKNILKGKTLARSMMNLSLRGQSLEDGLILDIGGGKKPSYFDFINVPHGATVINLDKQHALGTNKDIDLEEDPLPYGSGSVDQVLLFNVLEHIYHHQLVVREIHRVLRPGKTLIGFVPFLVNYHPDPNDYFRYTEEALLKIFKETNFRDISITPIGYGPFAIHFNNLSSFMPTMFNVLTWPVYYLLDCILIAIKPSMRKRFPVGYLFVLRK